MKDQIVYTQPVTVSREQLESFLNIINKYLLDEEDEKITVEECLLKPDLMKYICGEAIKDGAAMWDPLEFWNNDGWCDIKDHR